MELYIEKKFIDNFYINVKTENPTKSEQILINIFQSYGDVDSFIDVEYDTLEELKNLKVSNKYLSNLQIAPIGIDNIKTHFFKFSECKQTILLLYKTEEWFDEAENKGALCLSLESFEKRITELTQYADSLDIDVDEFEGWEMFEFMQRVPFNKITLCDNFVLTEKKDGQIQENIIPLLKVLLRGKEDLRIPVKIFTREFNTHYPHNNEQLLDEVKQKFTILNRSLANYTSRLKILNTKANDKVDFHRRELITNFFIISPDKGFNLVPATGRYDPITVWTIFTKKEHKRINKRMRMCKNHEDFLTELGNKNFQYYPE